MGKKAESEQKAIEFWLNQIKKTKEASDIHRCGIEWMANYWTRKLEELNNNEK